MKLETIPFGRELVTLTVLLGQDMFTAIVPDWMKFPARILHVTAAPSPTAEGRWEEEGRLAGGDG